MKTLLTGGAGYIGSHTAVAMLDAGHDVAVVDNFANSSAEAIARVEKITGKKVALYEADVADKERMMEILKAEMPDCIIHFAGLKAVGESVAMPVEYYRNNIDTTLTLLECMRELGLTNIVFSSSATVYGEDNVPPFTEDAPKGMCTNPYGWTKWMQEQMLTDAAKASKAECDRLKAAGKEAGANEWKAPLSVVLLRYFNPVGAHESGLIGEDPKGIPNNLLPYVAQVASGKREMVHVFGNDYDTPDGTGVRDYIHVVDLAKGHVSAIKGMETLPGVQIFNLGTGNGYSVLDIIKAFSKACGHDIPYVIDPRRPGDVATCYSDPTKAREVLGWVAENSIEDMCRDAWRWQSRNPDCYVE